MASAVEITPDHHYGRVGQKMKRCSKCRLNFIGGAVVERFFGVRRRNKDGLHEHCKRCLKRDKDTRRAVGRGFQNTMNSLGCQNPFCTCSPEERVVNEQHMQGHHRDPATKNFNPSEGGDRTLAENLEEEGLLIRICAKAHRRAHDKNGALTQYGHQMNAAWDEQLAGYTTSRDFGVMPGR